MEGVRKTDFASGVSQCKLTAVKLACPVLQRLIWGNVLLLITTRVKQGEPCCGCDFHPTITLVWSCCAENDGLARFPFGKAAAERKMPGINCCWGEQPKRWSSQRKHIGIVSAEVSGRWGMAPWKARQPSQQLLFPVRHGDTSMRLCVCREGIRDLYSAARACQKIEVDHS